jgi:hypothetical protein
MAGASPGHFHIKDTQTHCMTEFLPRLFRFLALVCLGLVAGATFGIWQGFDPRPFPIDIYVPVNQNAVRGLNVLLPVIGTVAIISLAISAWFARRDRSRLVLFLGALACALAAGLITRFLNQPINAQVMTWTTAAHPGNWEVLRDAWWHWHVTRTLLSMLGLALLSLAVVTG